MRRYLFLWPAAFGLVFVATLLIVRAGGPRRLDYGIDFSQPLHLVTRQMEIETAAMRNRRVPEVDATSDRGSRVAIAPSGASKPEFVLFIKDACPCSIEAQPIFNALAGKYRGKVEFLGVIDGDAARAKEFASQFNVGFPVVGDRDLSIIHAYEAKSGVYSALIARNGHIVNMWPGYSVDILRDMNSLLSQEAAVKTTPFDPQYAPVKKAAGCAYASES